jgi:hypothetical protein
MIFLAKASINRAPNFFINEEKFNGEWRDDGLLQSLKTIVSGIPSRISRPGINYS